MDARSSGLRIGGGQVLATGHRAIVRDDDESDQRHPIGRIDAVAAVPKETVADGNRARVVGNKYIGLPLIGAQLVDLQFKFRITGCVQIIR